MPKESIPRNNSSTRDAPYSIHPDATHRVQPRDGLDSGSTSSFESSDISSSDSEEHYYQLIPVGRAALDLEFRQIQDTIINILHSLTSISKYFLEMACNAKLMQYAVRAMYFTVKSDNNSLRIWMEKCMLEFGAQVEHPSLPNLMGAVIASLCFIKCGDFNAGIPYFSFAICMAKELGINKETGLRKLTLNRQEREDCRNLWWFIHRYDQLLKTINRGCIKDEDNGIYLPGAANWNGCLSSDDIRSLGLEIMKSTCLHTPTVPSKSVYVNRVLLARLLGQATRLNDQSKKIQSIDTLFSLASLRDSLYLWYSNLPQIFPQKLNITEMDDSPITWSILDTYLQYHFAMIQVLSPSVYAGIEKDYSSAILDPSFTNLHAECGKVAELFKLYLSWNRDFKFTFMFSMNYAFHALIPPILLSKSNNNAKVINVLLDALQALTVIFGLGQPLLNLAKKFIGMKDPKMIVHEFNDFSFQLYLNDHYIIAHAGTECRYFTDPEEIKPDQLFAPQLISSINVPQSVSKTKSTRATKEPEVDIEYEIMQDVVLNMMHAITNISKGFLSRTCDSLLMRLSIRAMFYTIKNNHSSKAQYLDQCSYEFNIQLQHPKSANFTTGIPYFAFVVSMAKMLGINRETGLGELSIDYQEREDCRNLWWFIHRFDQLIATINKGCLQEEDNGVYLPGTASHSKIMDLDVASLGLDIMASKKHYTPVVPSENIYVNRVLLDRLFGQAMKLNQQYHTDKSLDTIFALSKLVDSLGLWYSNLPFIFTHQLGLLVGNGNIQPLTWTIFDTYFQYHFAMIKAQCPNIYSNITKDYNGTVNHSSFKRLYSESLKIASLFRFYLEMNPTFEYTTLFYINYAFHSIIPLVLLSKSDEIIPELAILYSALEALVKTFYVGKSIKLLVDRFLLDKVNDIIHEYTNFSFQAFLGEPN
ncbi:hypothetical protein HDV01_004527 [Terramyces sp. JEL0728]|nr:hypothetical protein HDV01_004527 [Terramyces sp. JEL0728]